MFKPVERNGILIFPNRMSFFLYRLREKPRLIRVGHKTEVGYETNKVCAIGYTYSGTYGKALESLEDDCKSGGADMAVVIGQERDGRAWVRTLRFLELRSYYRCELEAELYRTNF